MVKKPENFVVGKGFEATTIGNGNGNNIYLVYLMLI